MRCVDSAVFLCHYAEDPKITVPVASVVMLMTHLPHGQPSNAIMII